MNTGLLHTPRPPFPVQVDANRYRKAIMNEFAPYLSGKVIQAYAGQGLYSAGLLSHPAIEQRLLLDPEEENVAHLRQLCPEAEVRSGTVADLDSNIFWNAIVSIHALEHLEDDRGELSYYVRLLTNFGQRENGYLCLFVAARPELESPMDQRLGIVRRYTKAELKEKVSNAGFEILRMSYFNLAGYLGWWLYSRAFDNLPGRLMVRLFDRLVFPPTYWVEKHVCRPPLGSGILVVAQPR